MIISNWRCSKIHKSQLKKYQDLWNWKHTFAECNISTFPILICTIKWLQLDVYLPLSYRNQENGLEAHSQPRIFRLKIKAEFFSKYMYYWRWWQPMSRIPWITICENCYPEKFARILQVSSLRGHTHTHAYT